MRASSLLLVLLLLATAACGTESKNNTSTNNTSTNNTSTNNTTGPQDCGDLREAYLAIRDALPGSCSSSEDCQLIDRQDFGGCTGAVRADADLSEFTPAAAAAREACGTLEPNNFACDYPQRSEMQAACLDDRCAPIPGCDEIGTLPLVFCQEDSQCGVSTEVDPCGCPRAIRTDVGNDPAIDTLLEICDYSEMCALIDCAVGDTAVCNDEGMCELVE